MTGAKGELTPAEIERLSVLRAHTAEVNQRERDAANRGLIASMSIPPRPAATR